MDIFQITAVIISLSSIVFATMLYSGNRESKLVKLWFVFSITTALWSFSLYAVTAASTAKIAMMWQHVLDISAIFIPVFFFAFVAAFINRKNRKTFYIITLIATCLGIFSFSPLFKEGVTILYDFYWIDQGSLYFLFPVYFAGVLSYSLFLLLRRYFKLQDDHEKAKLRNFILATLVGFVGGISNFFPQLFNIYPFGNYFFILYIFIMSYGVLKHNVISTKILSTQLFASGIVVIFLIEVFRFDDLADLIIKSIILFFMAGFGLLLVRSVQKEVKTRERIEALAHELKKANERLKEMDQLKTQFLSIASHQFRSPLTAIKGYTANVLDGTYGSLPEQIETPIERVFTSANHLSLIVDDFLNLSRIEQGRMDYEMEVVDLKEFVESAVDEQRAVSEKKELELTFSTEGEKFNARIDRGKFKQVVTNLIDNALKYTPKGSVSVSLKRLGRLIRISVADTGVGIPKDDINALFGQFKRAKNANKANVMGTGLGLYIAKEIVQAHNGTIWVESEGEGKGSTFIIEVPAEGE